MSGFPTKKYVERLRPAFYHFSPANALFLPRFWPFAGRKQSVYSSHMIRLSQANSWYAYFK